MGEKAAVYERQHMSVVTSTTVLSLAAIAGKKRINSQGRSEDTTDNGLANTSVRVCLCSCINPKGNTVLNRVTCHTHYRRETSWMVLKEATASSHLWIACFNRPKQRETPEVEFAHVVWAWLIFGSLPCFSNMLWDRQTGKCWHVSAGRFNNLFNSVSQF